MQCTTSYHKSTFARVARRMPNRNVKASAFFPEWAHLSDPGTLHHIAFNLTQALPLADVTDAAAPAVQQAADAVKASGSGPFDWLAVIFEKALTALDGGLEKLGVPYAYGFAIILLTLLVKLGTYPLTKQQVESTVAMQAIQPRVKEVQAKFPNDPERLQLETARLYKEAGVNPLAGCLPTLATIPVFIGLYRALTLAAQDGLLTEGFFWIPSLGGPASVDDQLAGKGMNWLLPFVDGHPPLGWSMTIAYLIMPVMLVVSQFLSQRIISPPSDDPQQKQTQQILKFIPLMIGWFSLNVPSGLTLYWLTNNILTTAQQVYLKSNAQATVEPETSKVKVETPVLDKPSGAETNARRSRGEKFRANQAAGATVVARNAADARGKKSKGDKFRARKEQEMQQAGPKDVAVSAAPAETSLQEDGDRNRVEAQESISAKGSNGSSA